MATQNINYRNEHAFDERLSTLRSTLRTLLHEVTAETQPVSIDPDRGIDFYENVERFEIRLIESALEVAGGRQNRAAKLLRLPASTLCSKMKHLNIRYAGSFSGFAHS